jgi:hypothetical protein
MAVVYRLFSKKPDTIAETQSMITMATVNCLQEIREEGRGEEEGRGGKRGQMTLN